MNMPSSHDTTMRDLEPNAPAGQSSEPYMPHSAEAAEANAADPLTESTQRQKAKNERYPVLSLEDVTRKKSFNYYPLEIVLTVIVIPLFLTSALPALICVMGSNMLYRVFGLDEATLESFHYLPPHHFQIAVALAVVLGILLFFTGKLSGAYAAMPETKASRFILPLFVPVLTPALFLLDQWLRLSVFSSPFPAAQHAIIYNHGWMFVLLGWQACFYTGFTLAAAKRPLGKKDSTEAPRTDFTPIVH